MKKKLTLTIDFSVGRGSDLSIVSINGMLSSLIDLFTCYMRPEIYTKHYISFIKFSLKSIFIPTYYNL